MGRPDPSGVMRPLNWLAQIPRLLPLIFVMCAMPVLIFLAIATPISEPPDEIAHFLRADSIRHGEFAGSRKPRLDDAGRPTTDVMVRADAGFLPIGFEVPNGPLADKQVKAARVAEMLRLPWLNRLFRFSLPNTGVYPPTLYVPAAIGLQLSQWSGQGIAVSVIAARFGDALFYIAVGAAAIGLAQRGRVILFALLSLPMALSLAAAVSQDGPAIACSALAAALLTRPGWRAWWAGAGVLALVIMAKPYMLPLGLIVPTAMPGAWRPRRAAAGLAIATVPGVVWAVAMALFVAAPFSRGPARLAGPLWSGPPGTSFSTTNASEQLRILLADPTRLLLLPLRTAWVQGSLLWTEFVGKLGPLDVGLPDWVYDAWTVVLLAGLLAGYVVTARPQERPRAAVAIAAVTGGVAAGWLAFILQYLSWTRVGDALIEGMQGRYFLPIAVLVGPLAAMPMGRALGAGRVAGLLAVPAVVLAFAGLGVLPFVVLGAYYIR